MLVIIKDLHNELKKKPVSKFSGMSEHSTTHLIPKLTITVALLYFLTDCWLLHFAGLPSKCVSSSAIKHKVKSFIFW
jgi:hypothetical protein